MLVVHSFWMDDFTLFNYSIKNFFFLNKKKLLQQMYF